MNPHELVGFGRLAPLKQFSVGFAGLIPLKQLSVGFAGHLMNPIPRNLLQRSSIKRVTGLHPS
ncbi:MAG: hypothetical protein JXN62_03000 [Bacteroidales bacterium]|nr:hypothetical protein [Bacteroidales bacterium]